MFGHVWLCIRAWIPQKIGSLVRYFFVIPETPCLVRCNDARKRAETAVVPSFFLQFRRSGSPASPPRTLSESSGFIDPMEMGCLSNMPLRFLFPYFQSFKTSYILEKAWKLIELYEIKQVQKHTLRLHSTSAHAVSCTSTRIVSLDMGMPGIYKCPGIITQGRLSSVIYKVEVHSLYTWGHLEWTSLSWEKLFYNCLVELFKTTQLRWNKAKMEVVVMAFFFFFFFGMMTILVIKGYIV